MKFTVLSALAAFAASSALADNQQMKNLLEIQRAEEGVPNRTATTIAVYANERGIGQGTHQMRSVTGAETRFEFRTNAHGDQFGVFVPVR
jgi:hypothetical protein